MESKQTSQFTTKREVPTWLKSLLEWDKRVTKTVFNEFDKKFGYQNYRSQMKWLENSCHGIPWLVIPVAMLYLGAWPGGLELWINLLIYVILDICCVAIIKAFARRRRPSLQSDEQWFAKVDPTGVDKFSFPSGHASRAAGFFLFFWSLYPLSRILVIPILIWSSAVSITRVFLCRHHLLDVVAGIFLAYLEYLVMCFLWLNEEKAAYLFSFLGGEDPWSSG